VAAILTFERRQLRIAVRADESQIADSPVAGVPVDVIQNQWNRLPAPFRQTTDRTPQTLDFEQIPTGGADRAVADLSAGADLVPTLLPLKCLLARD
jgi:hypothetical protein